jgi:hypothetical protein
MRQTAKTPTFSECCSEREREGEREKIYTNKYTKLSEENVYI